MFHVAFLSCPRVFFSGKAKGQKLLDDLDKDSNSRAVCCRRMSHALSCKRDSNNMWHSTSSSYNCTIANDIPLFPKIAQKEIQY